MDDKKLVKNYYEDATFLIDNLINDYSKYIYTVVKNMGNALSEDDIKEIVSDVFIVIWNNRNILKKELPIKPYIVGVTRNVVRNKYRNLQFTYNIEDYENSISENVDINYLAEEREKDEIIKRELMQMNVIDRKIFVFYYYYSKNVLSISKELNISESSVKTKLHRIRKKLKKALNKGGYFNE